MTGCTQQVPMNLTIKLPDEDVEVLKVKAAARGILAEQYALQVLQQDLAPEWLRKSRSTATEDGFASFRASEELNIAPESLDQGDGHLKNR